MSKPWYESLTKQIAITPKHWGGEKPVVIVHYYKAEEHAVYDLRDHKYLITGWQPASNKQITDLLHTNN